MIKFTRLFTVFLLIFFAKCFFAGFIAVQFSYNHTGLNDSEVLFNIKGKIDPGIKLFALQKSPDDDYVFYNSI